MFKDTKEGQTHSWNDGCGDLEHNLTTNEKPWWEEEFDKDYNDFHNVKNWLYEECDCSNNGTVLGEQGCTNKLKHFISKVDQRAREEAVKEFAEMVVETAFLEKRRETRHHQEYGLGYEDGIDKIVYIIKKEAGI